MLLNFIYLGVLTGMLPWLLWRSLTTGRYRRFLSERLLGPRCPLAKPHLPCPTAWFHGVSVGEIHLLAPLVTAFQHRFPNWRVVVSSTTDTGLEEARRKFAHANVIVWPFDFTWAVQRTLDAVCPQLIVLAESELWPNFLAAAARRGIPTCVVNGRLSPRTAARLRHLPVAVRRHLLQPVTRFAMQNEEYARQLVSLGVTPDKIVVTGSLKFDGAMAYNRQATLQLAHWLGVAPPYSTTEATAQPDATPHNPPRPLIWLAGSTHAPEEEIVLEAFSRLRARYPHLHLILVPRHPDRFEAVARLVVARGLPFVRRSQHPQPLTELPAVILWDTVGELQAAWGLADVGFVGGSLDGHRGGQSMIEPAAQGVPCLFGPYVWNFRLAAQQLVAAGGAVALRSAADLEPELERLLQQPQLRQQIGQAARQLVASQQGALRRTLQVLESLITTTYLSCRADAFGTQPRSAA
ncbi:MAG: 3-deoxy-D-manno-octulosonic acid transferase [Gemmataceae bacterium]|nr:3-deoxy-D-manno-octulosonic acid transferase [Gemmataceae bacterium]